MSRPLERAASGAPARSTARAAQLEVAPDAELQSAARVAAQLASAPIAFVALFSATMPSFRACVGIEPRRLDRAFALRAHEGGDESPLVVVEGAALEDDAKLGGLAGGARPKLYAGVGLRDASGAALATLGVLDSAARGLDDVQRAGLLDLADVVRGALLARQQLDALAREATLDPLTGLASRRPFEQALQVELHHSMRTGEPFTLLRLSIDGICDIRNGFGNADADGALREVAARVAKRVRLGDVFARLGGNEFAIVMRHGAASAAEVLATRVIGAVREPLTLAGGDVVGVRACVGIAAYTDDLESASALQAQAEQALAAARREHERRWNFFGRKFDGAALRLVEIAAAEPDAEPPAG